MTPTLREIVRALSLDQIAQYVGTTDRGCWIIDYVLDPHEFANSTANINFVEDCLAATGGRQ